MQSISTIGLDIACPSHRKKHMAVFVERRHFHGHALRCRGNPLTLARFAYTEDVAASIPAPPTIAASSTSHPTAAR